MPDSYELDDVDVLTTGTVGRPGSRVFYLQARFGRQVVAVKCEKQQVDALGRYLAQLLSDLPEPTELPLPTSLELSEPVIPVFTLGTIGVAYETTSDRVVLAFDEFVETDDEGEPLPESLAEQSTLRLRITRGQALAFARRSIDVVSAGRPSCRYCGQPLDPDVHACPRMN
jgi:uncharacterized repeat protein (TIGR03847 family)